MSTTNEEQLSNESVQDWEVTSRFVERRTSFTWRIERFSRRPILGYPKVVSPPFSFLSSKWFLVLYPNGSISKNEGKVLIYLFEVNPISETTVKLKRCLKDRNGTDYYAVDDEKIFSPQATAWGGTVIDRKFLLVPEMNELLYDDILTIYFEMSVGENFSEDLQSGDRRTITKKEDTATSNIPKSLEILAKDLDGLFKERKNWDVTLQVGDQTFPAHKCLLIARSKVFAAMFEHDMKESGTNTITITDIEYTVVSDLLRYIYSGNIQEMSVEKAIGLYVAADKYAMLELKAQCSLFLRKNLSEDNICDIAVLADAHNDGSVMDAAKIFVSKNTLVLTTKKWKLLAVQNPRLAYEVTLALALKKHTT